MKTKSYWSVRKSVIGVLAGALLCTGSALAGTDSMSCNTDQPDGHVELAAGDQNSANHLELSRPIAAGAMVDLDQCSGELTLVASKTGDLRIVVDLRRTSGEHMAGDYLEALEINPQRATVHLHLPRSVEARVTVEIPVSVQRLEVNLARGDLSLAANRVGGEREINVGYGHVEVQGNDDAYEGMEINVGLGSLHDHRKGGENHHLIVAHSFAGSGKGKIQINVGMGHVDVDPTS
jgi:hypothetical protein